MATLLTYHGILCEGYYFVECVPDLACIMFYNFMNQTVHFSEQKRKLICL